MPDNSKDNVGGNNIGKNTKAAAIKDTTWCVYMLQASDGRLYTGITNNMNARWKKHHSKSGAKFFRGRKPIALCYQEPEHCRSSASKREYQIKQFSKQQKIQLIIAHYGPHIKKNA